MAPKGIPERWLDYPRVGKRISGTNFIAFKVPLNEMLCQHLSSETRFTPAMLMEEVKDLSLIIDLTNTMRYYAPEVFTSRRIQYQKIFCEGHKVPNAAVVQRFFQTVEDHLRTRHGQGLIGVHCTHGVNRTGYLVCRYMIDKLGFNPADAIREFDLARGAHMERENYLQCLKSDHKTVNQSTDVHAAPSANRSFDRRDHDPERRFRDQRFSQQSHLRNVRMRDGHPTQTDRRPPRSMPHDDHRAPRFLPQAAHPASRYMPQGDHRASRALPPTDHRPPWQQPKADHRSPRSPSQADHRSPWQLPQQPEGQHPMDPWPQTDHRPARSEVYYADYQEFPPLGGQGGQRSSRGSRSTEFGPTMKQKSWPTPFDRRSSPDRKDSRHSTWRPRGQQES